jgi:remodeling and spacing factor 1
MSQISNSDEIAPELQDLHVKLLRKLKRSVVPEKFERALVKYCFSYGGTDDAFEMERYGYKHSSTGVKLRILKNLLEAQFDANVKFKNSVNAKPSTELRIEPFGRDKDGNVYYVQMDEKANIRVYLENTDEETWAVVASNREELVKLIEELRGNKPIRLFPKDLIDEDSSSNSRLSAKEEVKPENIEQKVEEQEYSIDNSASDEFPLKQTIRLVKKGETKSEEDEDTKPETAGDEKQSTDEKSSQNVAQKKRRRRK